MKRTLILLIIVTISSSIFAQAERNYAQELVDLLHQERYFEAIEFDQTYADKIPQNDNVLNSIYNIHMALAFNKPDKAVVFLEDFLADRNNESAIGPLIASYYGQLTKVYEAQQQFEPAISSVDKVFDYLKRNPFRLDETFVEKEINDAKIKKHSLEEKAKNEPLRRIIKKSEIQEIELLDSEYIRFEGLYNGKKIETIFDTGVSHYFVIEKELADEIGVKNLVNQDSIKQFNGEQINATEGYIDSIDFNGLKLYNIPVIILNKALTSYLPNNIDSNYKLEIMSNILKKEQIIMGVPTMKMIGKIEIDWENRLIKFLERENFSGLSKNSNFFLINNIPYINLDINTCKFTGILDTGANQFLSITSRYFTNNYKKFKLENISQKQPYNRYTLTKIYYNIPHEIIKDPQIYLNNKIVTSGEYKSYVIDPVWSHLNTFDGQVGVNFVKRIGKKVLFDFDYMTIR